MLLRVCDNNNLNHSQRFWQRVGEIYPDYRTARKELNQLAAHCPQWQK